MSLVFIMILCVNINWNIWICCLIWSTGFYHLLPVQKSHSDCLQISSFFTADRKGKWDINPAHSVFSHKHSCLISDIFFSLIDVAVVSWTKITKLSVKLMLWLKTVPLHWFFHICQLLLHWISLYISSTQPPIFPQLRIIIIYINLPNYISWFCGTIWNFLIGPHKPSN